MQTANTAKMGKERTKATDNDDEDYYKVPLYFLKFILIIVI